MARLSVAESSEAANIQGTERRLVPKTLDAVEENDELKTAVR
jgi:predicted regulator of amino acid metabolism with ACT domain